MLSFPIKIFFKLDQDHSIAVNDTVDHKSSVWKIHDLQVLWIFFF